MSQHLLCITYKSKIYILVSRAGQDIEVCFVCFLCRALCLTCLSLTTPQDLKILTYGLASDSRKNIVLTLCLCSIS